MECTTRERWGTTLRKQCNEHGRTVMGIKKVLIFSLSSMGEGFPLEKWNISPSPLFFQNLQKIKKKN